MITASVITEDYIEHDAVLNVSFIWHNSRILERKQTHRGTLVEIVERPIHGLTCYMDGSIQSCLADEELYHKTLVYNVITDLKERREMKNIRVCVLGGGEGCVVRDVFRYGGRSVKSVDMFEWDTDVIELFKWKYPQWTGTEVWNDSRLRLHFKDAFEVVSETGSFDLVIVDLFEIPDGDDELDAKWRPFIEAISKWTTCNIVLYAGLHYSVVNDRLGRGIKKCVKWLRTASDFNEVHINMVDIPSFSAKAVFIEGYKWNGAEMGL